MCSVYNNPIIILPFGGHSTKRRIESFTVKKLSFTESVFIADLPIQGLDYKKHREIKAFRLRPI